MPNEFSLRFQHRAYRLAARKQLGAFIAAADWAWAQYRQASKLSDAAIMALCDANVAAQGRVA